MNKFTEQNSCMIIFKQDRPYSNVAIWCNDTFGTYKDSWVMAYEGNGIRFYFKNQLHLTQFKLAWL